VTLINYNQNIDLSVAVSGGTAEAGDYTLNTSSLSFTGNGTQNVSIDIIDDADFDDETIEITLTESTSTGITVNPDQHIITVLDDETPPTPEIIITEVGDPEDNLDYRMVEICNRGSSAVDITGWRLEGDANGNTTVQFAIDVQGNVSLPPNECFVFGNNNFPPSDLSSCEGHELSGSINTNGNETFWLNDGTSQIDVYDGQQLDFENSVALRNASITAPNSTFTSSEWTINPADAIDLTPCEDPVFLPVEWLSFSAERAANRAGVRLDWTVASEEFHDFYEIQRSTNGAAWTTLGQHRENPFSEQAAPRGGDLHYQFFDEAPLEGLNLYRIRQVDIDGAEDYSSIEKVLFFGEESAFALAPNPARDRLYFTWPADWQEKNVEMELISMQGQSQSVYRGEVPGTLRLPHLQSGIYQLLVRDPSGQIIAQKRVIIQ
jgi:hypothetical protein